jgi:hypothetical protein
MSTSKILILFVGLACNLAVIAAAVRFAIRRKPGRSTLGIAFIGLSCTLIVVIVTWLGFEHDRLLTAKILAGNEGMAWAAGPEVVTLAAKGAVEAAGNVTLGLWLSLLPAVLSLVFLVTGFTGRPPRDGKPNVALAVLSVLCLTAGAGLALLALVDYLRFDDFFGMLLMLG